MSDQKPSANDTKKDDAATPEALAIKVQLAPAQPTPAQALKRLRGATIVDFRRDAKTGDRLLDKDGRALVEERALAESDILAVRADGDRLVVVTADGRRREAP